MSAPSRGRGGGPSRGSATTTPSSRGSNRAAFSNTSRGRGRGRGSPGVSATSVTNGEGILQKLRTGTLQRNGDVSRDNGRGRGVATRGHSSATRASGNSTRSLNAHQRQSAAPNSQVSSPGPAATSSYRDFTSQMSEKYNLLKPRRDAERKKAIKDGFLSDPDQKTSLDKAITPVGTCTEMCPEFERVERIVQNMVDKAEKVMHTASGRDIPSEERMVKRFRRSAAGYDEQLPSDIRTPETLKKTLDYLFDRIVGAERLASIHKFVWDRTRGIRNDFSIQQVSRQEDVKVAVNCYERIARFHILSMHQLSNPDNLQEGEHFEPQQEREQLNNTLLSLMYYYDDHRDSISFPNEAEFRAYCILFELQSLHPDLEERMQSWPQNLLDNPKVQTAFKIYSAAGNTIFDQGPLRPFVPYPLAQSNSGKFWTILASREVSYMMACVAEITFNQVRFAALDALWRSGKSAPQGQQSRNQDWTITELTNYLGFDDEEQTLEFVQEFGLGFGTAESGEQYLDMTALSSNTLDKSSIPSQQIFSASIVEEKRYRRTLVSVINGISIAAAIRQGLVVETPQDDNEMDAQDASEDEQSLFIPELSSEKSRNTSSGFGSAFNPEASAFTPSTSTINQTPQQTFFGTKFGSSLSDTTPKSVFGSTSSTPVSQSTLNNVQTPAQSGFSTGSSSTLFGFGSQSGTTKPAQPPIPTVFKGFGADVEPANATGFASNPIYPTFNLGQQTPTTSSQPLGPAQVQAAPPPSQIGFATSSPLQVSQPQFGQNIAAKPGSGQFHTADKPAASPISTFFGQKLFEHQVKNEEEKQKEKRDSGVSGATTTTFAPAPAPALASASVSAPPASFVSLTPAESSQPTAEIQKKTPSFWSSGNQADVQPNSVTTSQATATFDQDPQETPFFSITKNPISNLPPTKESSKPTPVFNFTKPIEPPNPPTESPFPLKTQGNTHSTTPSGTPVKKQSSTFLKLSHLEEAKASTQAPPPVSAPVVSSESAELPNQARSQSTTITSQVSSAPAQPVPTKIDRTKVVAQEAARLVLVQPQGLLEYFIGNHVSSILIEVVKNFQKDQQERVMTFVRTRFLSRKFFRLWKRITQQRVLEKRAKQRRKLLAVAMKNEQKRQRRNEEELELIIAAAQETKHIQQGQRLLKQQAESSKIEDNPTIQSTAREAQSAGQKRKVLPERDNKRSFSGVTAANGTSHKRSRTDGAISEPSLSVRSSSSPSTTLRQSAASSRFTQSFFGRSSSSNDPKRSTASHKIDSTRSDYFKLKAMGIDPNTPLIPDTARSLAIRQQKLEEERQASMSRIRARRISASPSPSLNLRDLGVMPPPPKHVSAAALPFDSAKPNIVVKATQAVTSEEDEFLRELREAREAMVQDTEWFKVQTTEMEKEVKQQELPQHNYQGRHSHSTQSESLATSTSGFALVNGYEYLPATFKPGQSLSRTEQRIQKTGAHGLATKTPGGRVSDYVPVAMSKRSALRYSTSSQDDDRENPQPSTKRVRSEANLQDSSVGTHRIDSLPLPAFKRPRSDEPNMQPEAKPSQATHNHNHNAFAALNDMEEDAEDEYTREEDEQEEEDSYRNGDEGDTEDAYESEEEEEELNEEDDGEEELDDDDHRATQSVGNHPYLTKFPMEDRVYDDDENTDEEGDENNSYGYNPAFAYPTISRGTSGSATGSQSQSQIGPGASVDDALVLSD